VQSELHKTVDLHQLLKMTAGRDIPSFRLDHGRIRSPRRPRDPSTV
jgi:hypothetical protein